MGGACAHGSLKIMKAKREPGGRRKRGRFAVGREETLDFSPLLPIPPLLAPLTASLGFFSPSHGSDEPRCVLGTRARVTRVAPGDQEAKESERRETATAPLSPRIKSTETRNFTAGSRPRISCSDSDGFKYSRSPLT